MKKESLIFGIAGMFMGLLCGWILGSQSGSGASTAAPATTQAAAPAASAPPPVTFFARNLTRVEMWSFFTPPPGGAGS